MSYVVDLYRGKPQHPSSSDGRMALSDHLREFRARLLRSVTVVVIGVFVALYFYDALAHFLTEPYYRARAMLDPDVDSKIVVSGLATSLLIQLRICALASIVLTSPYWLLQIWRFVLPGLHPHERRWTRVFAAVAGPLFLAGAALGYWILPKAIQVLLNLTPADMSSLVQIDDYITFLTRMVLIFGISFEIPLFIVMLNVAGVLPSRVLARYRAWYVLGAFVFAAVATPSTDPISMCFLAVPLVVLIATAEGVCKLLDRRRGTPRVELDDDRASRL